MLIITDMDPTLFYGPSSSLLSKIPHDGYVSEDSDMSDDDCTPDNILAPDSDDDETSNIEQATSKNVTVSDSDPEQR